MFSFPLYILLGVYLLALIAFLIFFYMILYHVYMSASFTPLSITFFVFVGTVALISIVVTFYLLRGIDWTDSVMPLENNWTQQDTLPTLEF